MIPFLVFFAIIAVLVAVLYHYSSKGMDFFENTGVPHLKPRVLFGNMFGLTVGTCSLSDILEKAYHLNENAKYVGLYEFGIPVVMIRDPELLKIITIKQFDNFPNHRTFPSVIKDSLFRKSLFALENDKWRSMRAHLSPAFTSSKMKVMFKCVADCATNFTDSLCEEFSPKDDVNIKEIFNRYSLDVIASTAFGITVNSLKEPDNKFVQCGKKIVKPSLLQVLKFFFYSSFYFFGKEIKVQMLPDDLTKFFTESIEKTVEMRDKEGIFRPDMIQLLMQARDNAEKGTITTDDIAAQAFLFFLGGFESPSTILAHTVMELAANEEIQTRLQAEIDETIEKCSGQVTYEELLGMKYLDAVVSEALRLYTPTPMVDRGGSGVSDIPPALPGLEPLTIPTEVKLWLPIYCIHRDPKYFPNPLKFDPERFAPENLHKIQPFTYLPFGLGPRVCIANRFALMELKLALFHILARCNFVNSPKRVTPMRVAPGEFNMVPVGGYWVRIQKREK